MSRPATPVLAPPRPSAWRARVRLVPSVVAVVAAAALLVPLPVAAARLRPMAAARLRPMAAPRLRPMAALRARPVAAAPMSPVEVVVLARPGPPVFRELTEQFVRACRVRPRVVDLAPGHPPALRPSDVVFAIGQEAVDAMAGSPAYVVTALAARVPPGMLAADALPPPGLALHALKAARPSVAKVLVLYGPRTEARVDAMEAPARSLGMTLVRVRAVDGPSAVRALSRAEGEGDALWLAPDPDVLSPQVFRYALALQQRRELPIVGGARQQVKAGALLAVDQNPAAVGRGAAALANQLLAGVTTRTLQESGQAGTLEVVVNSGIARRLGADIQALRAMGARVE